MIITACTKEYISALKMLISTYQWSNPDKKIRVYCIDWIPRYQELNNVEFKYISIKLLELFKRSPKSKILILKSLIIKEEYDIMNEPFLWVDSDTLVMKDIKPLLDILKTNKTDMIITRRFGSRKIETNFAAAIIGFSKTENAKNIIENFPKKTIELEDRWFNDQIGLWFSYVMIDNINKVNLFNLTAEYHSFHGNPESMFVSKRPKYNTAYLATIIEKFKIPEIELSCA